MPSLGSWRRMGSTAVAAHHSGPGTGGGLLSDGMADDPVSGCLVRWSDVASVAPVGVAVAPVGEQGVGVEAGSFQ